VVNMQSKPLSSPMWKANAFAVSIVILVATLAFYSVYTLISLRNHLANVNEYAQDSQFAGELVREMGVLNAAVHIYVANQDSEMLDKIYQSHERAEAIVDSGYILNHDRIEKQLGNYKTNFDNLKSGLNKRATIRRDVLDKFGLQAFNGMSEIIKQMDDANPTMIQNLLSAQQHLVTAELMINRFTISADISYAYLAESRFEQASDSLWLVSAYLEDPELQNRLQRIMEDIPEYEFAFDEMVRLTINSQNILEQDLRAAQEAVNALVSLGWGESSSTVQQVASVSRRAASQALQFGIIIFFVTLILAVSLTFVLRRDTLIPLANLSATIRRIAKGQFREAVEYQDSSGEVGEVAQAVERFRQNSIRLSESQKDLKQSESRLRDFAGSAADWFWEMGPDLRFTYLAGEVEKVTGYKPEELIGKSREEVHSMVGDTDTQIWKKHRQNLDAHRAFYQFEIPWSKTDGEIRYISINGQPRFSDAGEFLGYRGIARDTTENRVTEEALRRTQKMDAVGQLTSGIAHDFNNLLSVILGNVSLLDGMLAEDTKSSKRIKSIKKSALRAAELTKQLLNYSRQQPTEVTNCNINQLITGMDSVIERSITPQISIEYNLSEDLHITEIDSGDFQDALLNLVINARDAMCNCGRLELTTENRTLDESFCHMNPDLDPGQYICLTVSDTGAGISPENMEHIFEPFFTTKPQGKGTGLGLSMVFGFVKRSKGCVKVYSESEIGTTIHMYLPRTLGSLSQDISKNTPIENTFELPRGQESILVVDDEVELLELVCLFLKELGYNVIKAGSGDEALEKLNQVSKIDLLFSDVVMPGIINGFQLAERATSVQPQIKVLLTSGHVQKAITHSHPGFDKKILSKPYTDQELAKRIRATLDGRQ